MPTYQWECTKCEVEVDVHHKIADRDVPPQLADEVACLCEAPEWKRVMHAPGLVGKASYLDGQRKFHNFREAAQLKKEARSSKSDQKKSEIRSEIHKLGVKQ